MKATLHLSLVVLALAVFPVRSMAVTFDWAFVGNPGNADDVFAEGWGGVDHTYSISKHEVTTKQYTKFLNAAAATDPHDLYNPLMWSSTFGCKIERLGTDGSYTYHVATDREDRPVNFVSFTDAMRFVNWLHNGQGSGSTESGAYDIGAGLSVTRSADARYWVPSEDEWYKAAYHKNDGVTANYFDYPISSNSSPQRDISNPDLGNNANYSRAIGSPYWMSEVGEFENSASPYGTFDQGGNVWELTETLEGPFRRVRGGSWGSIRSDLYAGNARVASQTSTGEGDGVGFRVATTPTPASLPLTALALAGLATRRRR